ncbi:heme o synthase [Celeribacter naphthalenivorans]|uniref:heme o synthase n=1 Tax=Celeribacter naphthalenivorans TaxID=1614694 RepID=UPI001CFA1DD7|nr:heme o synthase [Celeribacter naphthalenivorans]
MTDATIVLDDNHEAGFGDYFALLKPRVMSLVVFTAFAGLIVAPGGIHPFLGFFAILCIAIGGGASGALNMWYDSDIDMVMKRTKSRPIPAGKVTRGEALGFGLTLSAFSVVMLYLATNWVAAALLAFTIFFYAVVYTMWLKRATPQNIVIGGASGALPPMIGWAAVTGDITLSSVLMFMLIFMWTPPHFWSLALFMNADYDKAKVPMLTVTHGKRATRNHILVYTILLAGFAAAMFATPLAGWSYLIVAVVMNAAFLRGAVVLWRRNEEEAEADNYKAERAFFKLSLAYTFLHFMALMADKALFAFGIGGPF